LTRKQDTACLKASKSSMISRGTQEWLLNSWKDRVDARDREVEVTGIGKISLGGLVNREVDGPLG
jgi:hypothetical protein